MSPVESQLRASQARIPASEGAESSLLIRSEPRSISTQAKTHVSQVIGKYIMLTRFVLIRSSNELGRCGGERDHGRC